jgi:hypothetical protein
MLFVVNETLWLEIEMLVLLVEPSDVYEPFGEVPYAASVVLDKITGLPGAM